MSEGSTRREFFIGAGLCVGLVALGGVTKAFAGEVDLLRPPGAQDQSRLLSMCIKCNRCISICPQGCVEVANVADGFINARTPKMNFHAGYCDFCNKCIDACPTGALAEFDPATQKIGLAVVDTSKCIAYTRGLCVVCKDSCPYGALTFDASSHPQVDESLCNGCGECVMTCNVNVNRSFDGSFDRAIEVKPYGA